MYRRIAILSLLLVFAGCSSEQRPSVIAETVTVKSINLSTATTIGNHTYIPLDMFGASITEHVTEILQVLDSFEKKHPELKVTGWKLEAKHYDYAPAKIYGLWIDHEPRAKPTIYRGGTLG